jgi:hypothetical protein
VKVLQAPSNIANQAWLNAEALRMRGHHAEVWQFGRPRYGWSADRVFLDTADPRAVARLLLQAVEQEFDVVHFHYGRSLVGAVGPLPWMWDLPLWRALGTRVVFSFHGSDVRNRRLAMHLDRWSAFHFADIAVDQRQIEDSLAVVRSFADAVTVSNVANRPHLPEAAYLPLSIDLRAIPAAPWPSGSVPVVAHSPSARGTKGTDFVLAGLEKLRERGVAFELDLIEGVPNAEVVRRYARAHVVVEKLVNEGFGVAALEAMAVGRPVVSRVVPQVFQAHPSLPIVDADPDTFVDVMDTLLGDPARSAALGAQGRAYVEDVHDLPHTGARLERLYESAAPPLELVYPGWAVPVRDRTVTDLQARLHEQRAVAAAAQNGHADLRTELAVLKAENQRLTRELAAQSRSLRSIARRRLVRVARRLPRG